MRILKNMFLSIIILTPTLHGQIIITKLGHHPFHQRSLITSTDLINMVHENENDIKIGFELAGLSDIFNEFMMQLPNIEISKVKLQDGTYFEWMFSRKNGVGPVIIAKDLTWINKTPITAFKFHIDKNGKRYTFAVPLICSNIALRGITLIPLTIVSPTKKLIDKTLEKNKEVLSAIDDPKKAIERETIAKEANMSNINVSPNDVATPVIEPSVPIDDSRNTIPEIIATSVGFGALNILADIGYLHQFDPGHFLFGRVGVECNMSDNISLLGLIGIAPHISGTDGVNAFLFDVLGEYKFGKSFANLGVGGWVTKGDDDIPMENTDLDLIIALGTRLVGAPSGFNISLLFETRQGLGEIRSIHEIRSFGRYGLGLRFRF